MIRTQVQLTEAQAQALKDLAAARQSSVAALIRQSVDYLIRQSGHIDVAERRRRAIAAAGRFRSGQANISTEHDRHLAGAYQG
ncbi:MAG: ribbon-helix-helix protein, CopG family [Chloroflexota bacterium]|nr:ribbon-helix-helix protein, CopG family [Chloroflexota bacterium]